MSHLGGADFGPMLLYRPQPGTDLVVGVAVAALFNWMLKKPVKSSARETEVLQFMGAPYFEGAY